MGQAERYMKKACESSGGEPRYLAMLGRFYHDRERFEEAHQCYAELRDNGMIDPDISDERFASTVEMGYFLSLLFSHQYETVMQKTEDWRMSSQFRRSLGTFRASAIKRMAEKKSRRERIIAIKDALEIFDEVIDERKGETEPWIFKQFSKVVAELLYSIPENYEFDDMETQSMVSSLHVIDKHIFDAIKEENRRWAIVAQFSALEFEDNPFAGRRTSVMIRSMDDMRKQELVEAGFKEITVTNVPETRYAFPNYLFGRAEDGGDHFCHFTAFEQRGGSWEEWRKMNVGDRLMIVPGAVQPGKATPRAEEIEICYL